jgi:threonine aldolase
MTSSIIDLRSDTVTMPTPGMKQAMMDAPVGDDVFGEDPSVNRLELEFAGLFGQEAALFCPSGTMCNQIAIRCHIQPGDEVICERNSHIFLYEGGGMAFNSGGQARTVDGDRGRITAEQVAECINPDDVHRARTSLVWLENTSNRGGGSCYDFAEMERIRACCDEHQLALHLDGARLFNALVARQENPRQYGALFDSLSVCLSKGLGCPVGSVLVGSAVFIQKARRVRKVFGGSMRQAGFLAAAGIYALREQVQRLAEDHAHAKWIGEALEHKEFVEELLPVETNIVIFRVRPSFSARELVSRFRDKGIRCIAISPSQIRMVTHLDVSASQSEAAVGIIRSL